MSDGNLLTLVGIDVALLTAGSAGGFVRSVFGKQGWRESLGTMAASALTGNYFAGPAQTLVSSGLVLGLKVNAPAPAFGFGVGFFAVVIFAWLQTKLASASGAKQ